VFAADTVSRLLGVPVRYYMGIDFAGFRDMINTVGGVDVDVPASFSAHYPANDDSSIDASWITVRFTKGPEHMTGERAIEFARARETIDNVDEGTDFARSRRQRLIIEAFKNRLLQPGGLIHLPQLAGLASTHVDTNYSVPDLAGLSQLALDWKNVHIYQTALTDLNYLEDATGPDGTYAVVPRSTTHTWAQIAGLMQKIWADPATGVAIAQTHLVVENDTGVAGAASRASAILAGLGYQVDPPVSGTVRTASRLLDPSGQQLALPLVPGLKKDLGLRSLDLVDDTVDSTAPFVLQLGSDDLNAIPTVVPSDGSSPTSAVGIEKFGVWAPDTGVTVVALPVIPTLTVTPVDLAHRTPTALRGGFTMGTPTEGSGRSSPTPARTPPKGTPARTPTSVVH
jgi:LCP family protein required for cell wall assembly